MFTASSETSLSLRNPVGEGENLIDLGATSPKYQWCSAWSVPCEC